jgi:hypothetical protein
MPDLIAVFAQRWKFILGISLLTALVALFASLFSPKEFLSKATALPTNSMVSDKARIFNNNIEALYPEIGTADELDRLEGTAHLDTIFIATAKSLNLAAHYGLPSNGEEVMKAVLKLKKQSKIARTGYGELQVKVWDENRETAAALANSLMQNIQDIHRELQLQNNRLILQKLKDALQQQAASDTTSISARIDMAGSNRYRELIREYELSIQTMPKVLLTVEPARPSLWPDRPKTWQTTLLAFLAAIIVTYLVSLLVFSKRTAS